jgi:demethylmenaquinone methyltransferase / 2-methoxy-6-polyprenyl-1,4-benzoquinol methylase
MFDRIARDYERVNRVISLGRDRRWRRTTVGSLRLPVGSVVLDLACGTGDMCRISSAAGYQTIGVDFSANMLQQAGRSTSLVRADVCRLPVEDEAVDGITCGFALRNLVDLPMFFSECARVLRRGGRVAVVDVASPEGVLARVGHRVWFGHVVPWLGARMSEPAAYRYLAASTVYLPPRNSLRSIVGDAGFDDVKDGELMFGAVRLLNATRI